MSSLMSRGPHAVGQNPDPVAMEAGQSVSGAIVSGGANTGSRCDIGNCGALPLANPDPVAFDGYNQTVADTTQTIRAEGGTTSDMRPIVAYDSPLDAEGGATSDQRQIVATTGDCTHALTARGDSSEDGTGRGTPIVAAGSFWDGGQVSQCIDAVTHKGQTMPEKGRFPAVITHAAPVAPVIRRLTPVECLRLQGFPDDWFEGVPGYSDTKAYRAVGNSVAIPCVEWIFQRVLEFDKTQE